MDLRRRVQWERAKTLGPLLDFKNDGSHCLEQSFRSNFARQVAEQDTSWSVVIACWGAWFALTAWPLLSGLERAAAVAHPLLSLPILLHTLGPARLWRGWPLYRWKVIYAVRAARYAIVAAIVWTKHAANSRAWPINPEQPVTMLTFKLVALWITFLGYPLLLRHHVLLNVLITVPGTMVYPFGRCAADCTHASIREFYARLGLRLHEASAFVLPAYGFLPALYDDGSGAARLYGDGGEAPAPAVQSEPACTALCNALGLWVLLVPGLLLPTWVLAVLEERSRRRFLLAAEGAELVGRPPWWGAPSAAVSASLAALLLWYGLEQLAVLRWLEA